MVHFTQVDVFTQRPFFGNPVAVILDAQALDGEAMQGIARWTNLSETAFVLPPDNPAASYRVRIFTPQSELPFAGHPSVGTAHALIEAGLVHPEAGPLVQECAAGLLPLQVYGDGPGRRIFVRSPTVRLEPRIAGVEQELSRLLGMTESGPLAAQVADNGPRWWLVDLGEAANVRALHPDMSALANFNRRDHSVGVAVFGREAAGGAAALAVRCFCPADGIPEDPVTGSANACIAGWLAAHHCLPANDYRASQGRELGRDGMVHLTVDGDGVWLGGHSVSVIDGRIRLPC
ncbi:MAG: PhzF family phenazine biosynthesis protein [Lysobacterales bacterium]